MQPLAPTNHFMQILVSFVPAIAALAAIFIGIELLCRWRASAMRSLASKWGLEYTKGDQRWWILPKKNRSSPVSFRLRAFPVNTIRNTWNVIEGERGGIRVLILDSILSMGGYRGRYSTFIAVRAETNPFEGKSPQERIAHSNGWTALYRLRFWQVPWTLSIRRIEELLGNLRV